MTKVLPIWSDADKCWIERRSLMTLCVLVFPEEFEDAKRAFMVLNEENHAMEDGRQSDYGQVGSAVQKIIVRRLDEARLAGIVFYQVLLNLSNYGRADFRKALFAVSDWASTTKTARGKALSSDLRGLERKLRKYSSALHYWAAYDLLSQESKERAFNEPGAFEELLIVAAATERLAISGGINDPSKCPSDFLNSWSPWSVPNQFLNELTEDKYHVSFPDLQDEQLERLSSYDHSLGRR